MSDTRDHRHPEAGSPPDDGVPMVDDAADDGARPDEAVIGLADNPVRLLLLVGVFAALGLFFGVGVLVILGAIVVSIFLHEMGHYLVARWTGMKATEFFIGFGPKLWSFRRGETEFGVKLVLAGRLRPGHRHEQPRGRRRGGRGRTFRGQSYPRRALMAFAGPAMNFAFALVLLFVLFAGAGIPESSFPVTGVVPDSAADEAGLQSGDTIVAVDGVATPEWGERRRPSSTTAVGRPWSSTSSATGRR
ncbi:MAG: site-2 protease family protein [Acidimicrobiia bacterium]|nr:site-2 protease family protein [Acidimicrobiia bacterium]